MRRALAVLAMNALAVTACAAGGDSENVSEEKPNMSMPPSASRPPAPDVAPVEHNGVRYVQDSHDDRQGDQRGGYLAALDARTGAPQWRLKVYEVADSRAAGIEGGGIYFRAMKLITGNVLEIENEAGGIYHVNLVTRTVMQISGPPPSAPVKPAKPKPEPE
jgi:outer membrane protein assembly factor BamB